MMSSKSQTACKGLFSLPIPSFRSEKEKEKHRDKEQPAGEEDEGPNSQESGQKDVAPPRDGSSPIGSTANWPPEDQSQHKDKDKKAGEAVATMGKERRRPMLGLLTSLLPMLTSSRPDSRGSAEIHRKAVPGAFIAYTPPANTTASTPTPTTTTRTSEDSKSSFSYDLAAGLTPLSPIEQDALFPADQPAESAEPGPRKLQKLPTMPYTAPPPPPTTPSPAFLTKRRTPPRVPTVTAVQASPPSAQWGGRTPSPEGPPPFGAELQPNRLQARPVSPASGPRGRSVSAQSPAVRNPSADGLRAVSSPVHVRTLSKQSNETSPTGAADRRKARRSWFPGGRSRTNSDVGTKPKAYGVWILAPDRQVDYNTAPLVNGEKVCGFVWLAWLGARAVR